MSDNEDLIKGLLAIGVLAAVGYGGYRVAKRIKERRAERRAAALLGDQSEYHVARLEELAEEDPIDREAIIYHLLKAADLSGEDVCWDCSTLIPDRRDCGCCVNCTNCCSGCGRCECQVTIYSGDCSYCEDDDDGPWDYDDDDDD